MNEIREIKLPQVPNVLKMKKTSLLILFFVGFIATAVAGNVNELKSSKLINKISQRADKYFIFETNSSDYKVVSTKLNTSKLYKKDSEIELYNLKYENKLVLFSILPAKSKQNWTEVDIERISQNVVNFPSLKQMVEEGFKEFDKSGGYNSLYIKRQDIRLVIKKNNRFFVAENCVTEYFSIIEQLLVFPNLMKNGYINIKSPVLSTKEFESKYKAAYKENSPNTLYLSGTGNTGLRRPLEKPLLFHSENLNLFGYDAYKFWQFTDWPTIDGPNYSRGIDRFIYVPELGIIGGSFDAWFVSTSDDDLYSHYINEELLIPNSINDIQRY
ncbi:hypothetical protein BFS30_19705 [Pedobacter steynii]|uniref:Uncharacterized protein n=2 Tax=Pedobacter steynii TaxID=430522 RepID=A0A1D7QKJ8_9SPHI|nr:hypothetical protein BFS30_19705 [Pedobacter steynii]